MERWLCAIWLITLLGAAAQAKAANPDFVVSPQGRDSWSGRLLSPSADRKDGPFATLERAKQAVRELRQREPNRRTPVVVAVRAGTYFLQEPLLFTPEDSGTAESLTLYSAYGREKPLLSGGVRIAGWQTDAQGHWRVNLPDVKRGAWNFAQLFAGGERRFRPRLPKKGYYTIANAAAPSPQAQGKGFDRFQFQPGEIRADWQNRSDIEALCFQIWTMARLRLASVDETNHIAGFMGNTGGTESYTSLPKGNRYLLENVREALSEPGEWYLDRPTGDLTYIPRPGERPDRTEVIAPRLERLAEFRGDTAKHQWVQYIRLEGLDFQYTNWNSPPAGNGFAQAEVNIGAAIKAEGARNCAIRDCAVRHIGNYAIEWGAGCRNNTVEDCLLADLGAGGVKIGEQGIREDAEGVTGYNTVQNCLIAHGGRMHPAAVGVWIGHSPYNKIVHNTIFDFYYTGISVGWSWGYGRSLAHDNAIEFNRIEQIGQGVLSDMGGIYTLGLAPGTTLRNNLIRNVQSFDYGGWGLYPDEGSTGLRIENNIVLDCKTGGFHQHYGKDNLVRNNLFADTVTRSNTGRIIRTRAEDHNSFTFERNIVFWLSGPLLGSNWTGNNYKLDSNLYWKQGGEAFDFAGMSLQDWRAKGQDVHSQIADPLFLHPDALPQGDVRLKPNSPAFALGFQPIETRLIGGTGQLRKYSLPLEIPATLVAFPSPPH